jgi:serine/threonine-protein kinase HipA
MSDERHPLDVWLGQVLVGRLAILADKAGRCEFRFHTAYRETYPRPVLGQAFEEGLDASYFNRVRLPAFFANLLPEGALRAMAEKQLRKKQRHELHLLAMLGEDLPGAVRVTPPESTPPDSPEAGHEDVEVGASLPRLRFALSGVQLKVSVLRTEGGGLTIPASGLGGDWIVKLAHVGLPDLPENEHAMMTWASLAGLDAPPAALVPIESIGNLPAQLRELGDTAYAVPRFDRRPGGGRVHMEDFAQVLGRYPDEKYDGMTYERLADAVNELVGRAGFDETLRRLVFMAAIGNGDAHMKNWSLLYPDGVKAQVSPAYDLVSTVRYPKIDDALALPLHRSTAWHDISMTSFERIADASAVPRQEVRALVEETLDRIVAAAPEARRRAPWSAEGWTKIADHWRRVPLLQRRTL